MKNARHCVELDGGPFLHVVGGDESLAAVAVARIIPVGVARGRDDSERVPLLERQVIGGVAGEVVPSDHFLSGLPYLPTTQAQMTSRRKWAPLQLFPLPSLAETPNAKSASFLKLRETLPATPLALLFIKKRS